MEEFTEEYQKQAQDLGKKVEQDLKKAIKEEEQVEHLIDLFIIALFLIFIMYTFI